MPLFSARSAPALAVVLALGAQSLACELVLPLDGYARAGDTGATDATVLDAMSPLEGGADAPRSADVGPPDVGSEDVVSEGAPPDAGADADATGADTASDGAADAVFDSGMGADTAADSTVVDATPEAGGDTGTRDAPADTSLDAVEEDAPLVPILLQNVNATNAYPAAVAVLPFGFVRAHDAIIVCLGFDAQATVEVTDALNNTFVPVVGPEPEFNGDTSFFYIFLAEDSAAGADTITATLSAPPNSSFEVYAQEYSGLQTSNAFDVSAVAIGTSSAHNAMASGFAQTTAPHELILGYGTTGAADLGTGFTEVSGFDANIVEDEVVTSEGAYQATATAGGGGWIMLMATFRGQ